MALGDELKVEVEAIFKSRWESSEKQIVPEPKDLRLSNDAIGLKDATVLYADLDGSTNMVDSYKPFFSAEIYKTFLLCAAKLIKQEGGVITSYDGDRIMGIFLGSTQCLNATRCAMRINFAVKNIITPSMKKQYPAIPFELKHVVGVDNSSVMAARTGVRGDNDIVWVGRAPNYAAKLTSNSSDYSTWVTEIVYRRLDDSLWYGGNPRKVIWVKEPWSSMGNIPVYKTSWWWGPI